MILELPILKFLLLILKNLGRNKLRTVITCLSTMVLVFVVTMIWTVIAFLDNLTTQKGGNLKAIVTDRYDMQGQLPLSYADPLSRGAATKPGDKVPVDSMAWQIYLGSLDPENRTRENLIVLIATDVPPVAHPGRYGCYPQRNGRRPRPCGQGPRG